MEKHDRWDVVFKRTFILVGKLILIGLLVNPQYRSLEVVIGSLPAFFFMSLMTVLVMTMVLNWGYKFIKADQRERWEIVLAFLITYFYLYIL